MWSPAEQLVGQVGSCSQGFVLIVYDNRLCLGWDGVGSVAKYRLLRVGGCFYDRRHGWTPESNSIEVIESHLYLSSDTIKLHFHPGMRLDCAQELSNQSRISSSLFEILKQGRQRVRIYKNRGF